MAKSKKGSGQGPKPQISNDKPPAQALPAFDKNALLALTEKIEKGFGTGKSPQQKSDNRGQTKKTTNDSARPEQSKAKSNPKGPEPKQGNKRDARGNRKPRNEEPRNGNQSKKSQNGDSKDEKDVLLQEILALGGTQEDLQLIADAVSDDEDLDGGSSAPPDKSFRADLAKFVAGLGIDAKLDDHESEPELEEEAEEEEEVEWETSGDESPAKPAAPVKAQRADSVISKPIPGDKSSSSKDPGRLVSTSSS